MEGPGSRLWKLRRAKNAGALIRCAAATLILIVAVFIFVAFSLFMYILSQLYIVDRGGGVPFCCPDKARTLADLVNTSLDPCQNFHDYVCSSPSRIQQEPRTRHMRDYLLNLLENGADKETPAVQALKMYYRSCDDAVRHPSNLMAEMGLGIVKLLQVSGKMTPTLINRLIVITYPRYRFGNIIAAATPAQNARIHSTTNIIPRLNTSCHKCLALTVQYLNGAFNTSVTVDDLLGFYSYKIKPVQVSAYSKSYGKEGALEVLTRRLNEGARKEIGGELQEWLKDVTTIALPREKGLEILVDTFTEAADPYVSVYYIVAAAAYAASLQVEPSVFKRKHVWKRDALKICFEHMDTTLENLVEVFYAKKLTSTTRDKYLRDLYALVSSAIHDDIKSRAFLRSESETTVKSAFDNLKLTLPTEYTAGDVPLPNMTNDFGRNFLCGITYERLVGRVKRSRKLPSVRSDMRLEPMLKGSHLRVSPSYYAVLNFDSPMHLLLDMPATGLRMAQSVWAHALNYKYWKAETTVKIRDFYECFQKAYFNGQPMWPGRMATAEFALALPTVKKVVTTKVNIDWTTLTKTPGTWRLSHDQFFYVLVADSMCTNNGELVSPVERINVPLRHTQHMGSAFRCVYGAPMIQRYDVCTL